jgi:hypothetical protein
MSSSEEDPFPSPIAFNAVPETPAILDKNRFQLLLPAVKSQDQLLFYQWMEGCVRQLDEQRKRQNARIQSLVRSWHEHKEKLREDLLLLVRSEGKETNSGGATLATMIGSTFTRRHGWSASIEDEGLLLAWMETYAPELLEPTAGIVEQRPHLTTEGREIVKNWAIAQAEETGVVPDGMKMLAPHESVVTRWKASMSVTDAQKFYPQLFGDFARLDAGPETPIEEPTFQGDNEQ